MLGGNVLTFLAVLADRSRQPVRPSLVVQIDFVFPQPAKPETCRPTAAVVSNLCSFGYNTATAFSPTDALPFTRRAKMLMMIESTISLLTMVIILSRAINIIPT